MEMALAFRRRAPSLLRRDVGCLANLPPFLDIGAKHLAESIRALVGDDVDTISRKASFHLVQGERFDQCSVQLVRNVRRCFRGRKNADLHHEFDILDSGFRHGLHVGHAFLPPQLALLNGSRVVVSRKPQAGCSRAADNLTIPIVNDRR